MNDPAQELSLWRHERALSRIDYSVEASERVAARRVAARQVNGANLFKLGAASLDSVDRERESIASANPRIAAELQRLQDEYFVGIALGIRSYMSGGY